MCWKHVLKRESRKSLLLRAVLLLLLAIVTNTWDFFNKNKDKIEMTVVNPSLVLGPGFIKHGNSSEMLLIDIPNEEYPGVMDVRLAILDVRDVAEDHYRAMFEKNTIGKRYIIAGENVPMEKVVCLLKDEFGK